MQLDSLLVCHAAFCLSTQKSLSFRGSVKYWESTEVGFGSQQAWHPLLQLLHGCLASNHAAHQAYRTYVLNLWA